MTSSRSIRGPHFLTYLCVMNALIFSCIAIIHLRFSLHYIDLKSVPRMLYDMHTCLLILIACAFFLASRNKAAANVLCKSLAVAGFLMLMVLIPKWDTTNIPLESMACLGLWLFSCWVLASVSERQMRFQSPEERSQRFQYREWICRHGVHEIKADHTLFYGMRLYIDGTVAADFHYGVNHVSDVSKPIMTTQLDSNDTVKVFLRQNFPVPILRIDVSECPS